MRVVVKPAWLLHHQTPSTSQDQSTVRPETILTNLNKVKLICSILDFQSLNYGLIVRLVQCHVIVFSQEADNNKDKAFHYIHRYILKCEVNMGSV